MPEVKLVNITKKYGEIFAVREASLEVSDGEYISMIGPSGCGKTTLLKCIVGLIEPTEGEVYIDNKLVNPLPPESRGIGYVFQEINLFPHMNVLENVTYGLTVKGRPRMRSRAVAQEALDMVKLPIEEKSFPRELSGGARQKAAVARAIVSESKLLLLDEPFGALDTRARTDLSHQIRRLVKDLGLTAIHVTHDQEEAMSVSDRIVVMKAGRIVEVGTPAGLYLSPKQIFTANFLGETNFLEGRVVDTTPEGSVIDVHGTPLHLRVPSEIRKHVVAAIRPEFVDVRTESKGGENTWRGRIEATVFLGSVIRYKVLLGNDVSIAVRYPSSTTSRILEIGESVDVYLPPEHVILFAYPDEGLDEARELE